MTILMSDIMIEIMKDIQRQFVFLSWICDRANTRTNDMANIIIVVRKVKNILHLFQDQSIPILPQFMSIGYGAASISKSSNVKLSLVIVKASDVSNMHRSVLKNLSQLLSLLLSFRNVFLCFTVSKVMKAVVLNLAYLLILSLIVLMMLFKIYILWCFYSPNFCQSEFMSLLVYVISQFCI